MTGHRQGLNMLLSDTAETRLAWTRRLLVRALLVVVAFVTLMTGVGLRFAHADSRVWALAKTPGHLLLMRHALAPGYGDPEGFRLDDCSTQRNLSAEGRAQARRARDAFERNGVAFDLVLSSAWCRCLETARLATGREPEAFAGLNSFFADRSRQAGQMQTIRERLSTIASDARVLMVTHQVVISALTGRSTSSGDVIVARRDADGSLVPVGALELR